MVNTSQVNGVSLQTALTDKAPMILDATCSFGKVWPAHATIRIDIRPETNPDIVMDAKSLKFPNNHFDQIYCDPPHFIRKGEIPDSYKKYRRLRGWLSLNPFERYGYWQNNEQWFEFVDKTNVEFYRCIKNDGLLFYKITEARLCVKPKDLIERMTNFIVIKDEVKPSNTRRKQTGKVHYITFQPKERSI